MFGVCVTARALGKGASRTSATPQVPLKPTPDPLYPTSTCRLQARPRQVHPLHPRLRQAPRQVCELHPLRQELRFLRRGEAGSVLAASQVARMRALPQLASSSSVRCGLAEWTVRGAGSGPPRLAGQGTSAVHGCSRSVPRSLPPSARRLRTFATTATVSAAAALLKVAGCRPYSGTACAMQHIASWPSWAAALPHPAPKPPTSLLPLPFLPTAGYGVSHGKCKACRVANCDGCWANASRCQVSNAV
jgi:hypothetical protein